MLVKDIVRSRLLVTVSHEATLINAIDLMVAGRIGALPVLGRNDDLVGILTESDLLRRIELGTDITKRNWWSAWIESNDTAKAYRMTHGRKVGEVMTSNPETIDENVTLDAAVDRMEKRRVRRLPVLRQGVLVGIISRSDFVPALQQLLSLAPKPRYSDADIRQAILDEFNAQIWAGNCSIEVDVEISKVIIRGCSANEEQRAAIRVIAENVGGVTSVEDEIAVLEPYLAPGF